MPRAMSPAAPSPEPTLESLRPSSVRTNDSAFADSAISMGSNTPKQLDDEHLELRSPTSPKLSLSERLTQLAAAAWAAEQDSYLDDRTKEKVLRATATIEACLDEGEQEDQEEYPSQQELQASKQQRELEQAQLAYVHEQLAATVASMRMRQQEQRHINELAILNLDDVASTCAAQEQTIASLQEEVEQLRIDNQKHQRDSDGFQSHAIQLTLELEQKDLALQAMSSAVAGLDGWIQTSLDPEQPTTRRVRATSGRGRFRTHYYVDVPVEGGSVPGHDEVRDGITAWVRGFRDMEDAMNTHTGAQPFVQSHPQASNSRFASTLDPETVDWRDGEEWGEFQTVSSSRFD